VVSEPAEVVRVDLVAHAASDRCINLLFNRARGEEQRSRGAIVYARRRGLARRTHKRGKYGDADNERVDPRYHGAHLTSRVTGAIRETAICAASFAITRCRLSEEQSRP
jgi:hypothetical protein